MSDVLIAKKDLLELAEKLNYKYELSKTIGEDYYEPGMMENLSQYKGEFDEISNVVTLRFESKGMRYDNRTQNLERINVGDVVQICRDSQNLFNSNNFTIVKEQASLGNLPAELCNALAPMYDRGYATILTSKVSYLEKLRERSRYAKQGVLFIELKIQLRGM